MNFKHIMIIFKKEVKDIIRDRKTIFTSILVPLILMPVLFLLVGGGTAKMTREMTENITITLLRENATDKAMAFLNDKIAAQDENIVVVDPVDNAQEAIKDGTVKVVIDLDKDFLQKFDNKEPLNINILFDNSRSQSFGAVNVVSSAIERFNSNTSMQRLIELGINPDILMPVVINTENVADGSSGNMFLTMMLPMLIALLVAVGGIPAATDLIAGEKERTTMEPLLTTRPSRMSILLGKYLTINLFTFTSVISTLLGIVIAYLLNPNSLTMGDGAMDGFNLPLDALVLSLIITLLLGMTFSGIQIAISTYARNFKEGQTYLSMLIFIVMIPAYSTMMMQPSDLTSPMFLTPVLNTISAFKMILGGVINYSHLFLAVISSLVYVMLSLLLATNMFNKEKILFRN